MFFDTHAHVNDKQLEPLQKEIMNDLNSMYGFFEVGYDLNSSIKAVELAEKYKKVYAIIGTHPENIPVTEKDLETYRILANNNKVIAIGEIGLDYHYRDDNKEEQAIALIKQLELAHELGLPVVIHLRDAYGDFEKIIKENKKLVEKKGFLLHCYSGSPEFVRAMVKYNAYFALGGIITFKNARKDTVIKEIPMDRLLVETDCPYCTPEPFRGQLNKPIYVNYVIDQIAKVKNIDREELEKCLLDNTLTFFRRVII